MTPGELSKLRDVLIGTPIDTLTVRIGYVCGECATIDITTEDHAHPPLARLWSHPLVDYEQIPPHERVLERLVAAYNALPALLDHVDNLTRQIEAYAPPEPKVEPRPQAKPMTLGGIQRLLRERGLIPKGDNE